MLFCALGVNPFTNRNVEPRTMVEILSGLLTISTLLLFRKEWTRLLRRLFRRSGLAEPQAPVLEADPEPVAEAPAPVAQVAVEPLSSASVVYDAQAGTTKPGPTFSPLPQLEQWAMPKPIKAQAQKTKKRHVAATSVFIRLRAVAARAVLGTAVLLANFASGTKYVGVRLAEAAQQVGATVWVYTQRAWWASEPRIRRFDAWLDHTLHQNHTSAAVLDIGHEIEQGIRHRISALGIWRRDSPIIDLLRAFRK